MPIFELAHDAIVPVEQVSLSVLGIREVIMFKGSPAPTSGRFHRTPSFWQKSIGSPVLDGFGGQYCKNCGVAIAVPADAPSGPGVCARIARAAYGGTQHSGNVQAFYDPARRFLLATNLEYGE
jgi:hypothetical protein